ncbi:MAG: TraB/GumN family protein [Bacteroidales bacterium]
MTRISMFLLICIQFQFQSSFAQDSTVHQPLKNYQGLLWQITGPGMTKPSYLYGALETNQKLAYHLIDSFFVALNDVDRIILEMHPDSVSKAMRDPAVLKRVYKDMMASGYYPSYNYYRILQPKRFDAGIFPMFLSGMSTGDYGMDMFTSEMEEEKTIIDFVFMAALKMRKEVHGLVSVTDQLDMQDKAEKVMKEDMKKQKNIREDYSEMMVLYEKAFESYRKGDLGLLDSLYRRIVNSDALFNEVMYPAYKQLAEELANQLQSARILAVMDATTLAGSNGIIEELRRLGYELTPVKHYILTKPNKQKEKLEKMTAGSRLISYKSPTGIWEVKVPDYSVGAAEEQDGQVVFVDYLNNTTFSVTRQPTNAMLSFQDPQYLFKRMDSVIYEYVPGKILNRKDITHFGYPGVEITNKTTKGKIEQFRLIITPLEIIVFKVSGPRNYVKRKGTGRKYLASAVLTLPERLSWKSVSTGHGEFSISLPSYYIVDTVTNKIFTDPEFEYQAWDRLTSTFFLFKRNIHHDLNFIEEDTFDLNFMAGEMAKAMNMEVKASDPSGILGFPSQDFRLWSKSEPDTLFGRLILRGPSHYLLLTNARDSLMVNRFFDGFSILPFEYTLRVDTVSDSLLRYTVVSDIAKQETDRDEDEDDFAYWAVEEEDEKEDDSYKAKQELATYHFQMGAEYIRVDRNKEHDYKQYRHFEDLWNTLTKRATNDSDMVVINTTSDSTALFPWLDLELGDTNSVRIIRKRFVVNHGTIYTLSTMRNAVEAEQPYTRRFFSSFTPMNDTVIGRSIFEDNGKLFISHFISDDTQKVKQAISSLHMVIFAPHHLDSLYYIIAQPELMKRNLGTATKLIEAYGGISRDKYNDDLEKLYTVYQGSPAIQTAIFRALAKQNFPEARNAMLRILAADIPLPSDYSLITSLAGILKKKPDQAALLFPELFLYERYPEYSSLVYALLDDLVRQGKFRIEKHPGMLKLLLQRVEEELDRRLELDQKDKAAKEKISDIYSPLFDPEAEEMPEVEMAVEAYLEAYALMDAEMIANLADGELPDSKPESDLVYMMRILYNSGYQSQVMEQYYQRVLNGRNRNDALSLAMFLAGKGYRVPDSLWKGFAENPIVRIDFYKKLENAKTLEYFDTTWLNQRAFAESFIHISETLNEKDSLTFVERRWISTARKSGYVYCYKYKTGYGNERYWTLALVGIQPEDTLQVSTKVDLIKTEVERIYPDDDISELIDKQMKNLRKLHRKRFQNTGGGYDYGYYGYDEDEMIWEEDYEY